MGYSVDLRKRAVEYRLEGHMIAETSKVFGNGNDTLCRWMKQYRETVNLSPKPLNRTFKKIDPVKLKELVKKHSDALLRRSENY